MINRSRISSWGFTLVELLVAVVILSILSLIAVPHLLYAQTRARMSRVAADLRTLVVGIETYTVDHHLPPLDWNVGKGDPMYPEMASSTSGILHPGFAEDGALHPGLTTPVAYVNDCWMTDPFTQGEDYTDIPFDEQKYTYNWFAPVPLRGRVPNTDYLFNRYSDYYGNWRLGSVGPDQKFRNGDNGPYVPSRVYDPTNGLNSSGNIWRSQKEAEVKARPPLDELIDS